MEMKNIGDLENAENHEKLSGLVRKLKRRFEGGQAPFIIPGYCASNDETFQIVVEYIREQFGIPKESTYNVTIIPETDISQLLLKDSEKFRADKNDLLLIKSSGFERLNRFKDASISDRVAHDYDQDLLETCVKHLKARNINKKILMITQIGYSLGEKMYNLALNSALSSDFKKFMYVFEPQ